MRAKKAAVFMHVMISLWAVCASHESAGQTVIRHIKPLTDSDRYMVGLLKLALSYSDNKYTFKAEPEALSRTRAITYVKEGRLTTMWGGTSLKMEAQLAPVRIPAYKGLLGHRVFIIPKGAQSKFDKVQSLADLKRYTYGQGRTWSDTKILENAGFTIIKSKTTDSLLHMTDGGRFDGFPRGVHEPWSEITRFDDLHLEVEKNLMLVYKLAYYFFLNLGDEALVDEIEQGLKSAIADGSFDRYFYSSPQIKGVLEKANIANRKAYYIDNPTLPPKTPADQAELWLDLEKLKRADGL